MAQYKEISRVFDRVISRLSTGVLAILLASACTIDVDPESDGTTSVQANEIDQPVVAAPDQSAPEDQDQLSAVQPQTAANPVPDPTIVPAPDPDPVPDVAVVPAPDPVVPDPVPNPAPVSNPQLDASGIAISEAALAEMLRTGFVIENEQIVPTTTWICNDVFEAKRSYYFYEAGVINPTRNVAIERTLNADGTVDDITFFWSITSTDSVLLSSLVAGADDVLVPTGQQYDVNTIRFGEVDAIPVFSAQSLLRGSLVCATLNLR